MIKLIACDIDGTLLQGEDEAIASGCEVMISGVDTSYLCPKHSDMVELVRA